MEAAGARAGARAPTHPPTPTRGAGRTGERSGRPYQINERQEFPAPAVGLMRGHFDGLVVAQDRAVGQQDRHPQHLARDKRHVRERPGRLEGEEGGLEAQGARGRAPGEPWRCRPRGGAGRSGAGRGLRRARPPGPATASARRPARAGRRWRALAAAAAGRRGVSSFVISVILLLRSRGPGRAGRGAP